jgi:nucleoid-associated protein YgaU
MTEMGNVEKWVVLGVLALIVGILVVSLNVDDPLKKDKVVVPAGVDAPAVAAAEVPQAAPKADAGSSLLSANVNTAPPAAVTPTIPNGSILKTMEGLQESYMSDAMFYTWKSGDTFATVAQRFYGDPSRLATLKRLNEGRSDVQPGERVLIAVYDLDGAPAPATAPAVAPAAAADKKVASATPAKPEAPAATPVAAASGTAKTHLVKDGESLWKIAKQELGSGARWNEIYTANRDVLSSPEALHTGQKLRIP